LQHGLHIFEIPLGCCLQDSFAVLSILNVDLFGVLPKICRRRSHSLPTPDQCRISAGLQVYPLAVAAKEK
jgi:hypothetical protein